MKRPTIKPRPVATESYGRSQRTATIYDYQNDTPPASLTLQVSRLDDGRLVVDLFGIDGPVEVRLPPTNPDKERAGFAARYNIEQLPNGLLRPRGHTE